MSPEQVQGIELFARGDKLTERHLRVELGLADQIGDKS
jgi:hypothetical protein